MHIAQPQQHGIGNARKKPFNDHRSQLIGSRFFCYNSPAAAAKEVFKPSTNAESLLGSIKKKIF